MYLELDDFIKVHNYLKNIGIPVIFATRKFIIKNEVYLNNNFIRVLQNIVIYFFIFILGVVVCNYLDICLLNEIKCDSVDESTPSSTYAFINSSLEKDDKGIPLISLLNILFLLNVTEFLFLILLVLILYNKYINNINLTFISNLINKYMGKNVINWFTKYSKTSLKYNKKLSKYMFIYVSFMLIFTKLISLVFISDLNYHIDDYVLVYNHYKGIDKNCIFLLGCSNKLFYRNSNNIIRFYFYY